MFKVMDIDDLIERRDAFEVFLFLFFEVLELKFIDENLSYLCFGFRIFEWKEFWPKVSFANITLLLHWLIGCLCSSPY